MSERERVEALVWIRADLRTLYRMGSQQRQNLSDLTRRLDENARQIADLLEGNGLRDLLAEAKADALREAAEAQRCGGCKGEGSHRRHCPRHPNYHPWIPLADRAEGVGDSIGEPGLANQAWALAAAIRREMPNHPYRPARLRGDA